MLIYFDHPKSLIIILIEDRFDRRRLSGPRIAVEQAVVCLSPLHKRLCVLDQLLFRDLITDQIVQMHMRNVRDWHDFCPSACRMFHAERLVKPQLSDAEFPVELCHRLLKCFR